MEEQLNDLTELHQKEIENLKQTITDLEEKIQYQTEERHRDVHEMLESFQTRVSAKTFVSNFAMAPYRNISLTSFIIVVIPITVTDIENGASTAPTPSTTGQS